MRAAWLTLVLALAVTGSAHAQTFLGSNSTRAGSINLVFHGAANASVRFHETVPIRGGGTHEVVLGRVESDEIGVAILLDAVVWRCDRLVRHLVAQTVGPYGKQVSATTSVRLPSCRDRLRIKVPRRVRVGSHPRVVVTDSWGAGGIRPQLCVAPPGAQLRCKIIRMRAGNAVASRRFVARRKGLWRVETRLSGYRFRRSVGVGRNAERETALPVLLATGDSTMQGIDAFLGDRLADEFQVRRDSNPGTGISRMSAASSDALARRQVARLKPATTVVSIGANEGLAMDGVACCGEAWLAEYARRTQAMMRRYARGGRARVAWLTLPAPRDPQRQTVIATVNGAIRRAAAGFTDGSVVIVDLGAIFTPDGHFHVQIRHRGHTVTVREPDGVHLTVAGTAIAADAVVAALRAAG